MPLRLTGFLALLVSIPFFLYQALAFMASGLYENERGIVFSRTILGTILFFLGLIFCSLLVLPNVFNFFQSVGPESINITTDISKFLNFVLTLMLAFGFSFQIPILVNALIRLNIFKKHRLKEFRGIFLIICFLHSELFLRHQMLFHNLCWQFLCTFFLNWVYYLAMKKKRNPLAKDLKTPKYRIRVKPDKTKYSRKNKKNKN